MARKTAAAATSVSCRRSGTTLLTACFAIAIATTTVCPSTTTTQAFQRPQTPKLTSPKITSSISSDVVARPNEVRFPLSTDFITTKMDKAASLENSSTQQTTATSISTTATKTATNTATNTALQSLVDKVMNSYLGPRILLASIACFYGTNFPLGSIMDQALPASAASSGRFLLAALALSPFLVQIQAEYIGMSLLAGACTATGYVAQSLALVDTSPATVSFLGAAAVLWCPLMEAVVDRTPMGPADRPQTWLAGMLCILGVGVLELCGGGNGVAAVGAVGGAAVGAGGIGGAATGCWCIGTGDALALLQAICFSTGIFIAEKMVSKHPSQALPVTSIMVATTALISMVWALNDGWMGTPGWESMTLPGLFMDPSMHEVAAAVVWTGIMSTSLSFFLETFSLQKVPPAEATVILSTEPLWAAGFASILLGESFGWNDYVGGVLILAACLANSLKPSDFQALLPQKEPKQE
ncbi:MAG: hypothetical protein SGBAC_003804 [Bacillariaceae sp.]